MKTTLAVIVLLVVATGTVYTQAPPPPNGELPRVPALNEGNLSTLPSQLSQSAQPKERNIDQLLDEIQAVRAQRAELEKKEQSLVVEVRKLVDKQTDRLNKLGLGLQVQPPPVSVDVPAGLVPGGIPSTGGPILPPPNR